MTSAGDNALYNPKGRILAVDDDPMACELTRAVLSLEGHEVVEACDGTEGLRRLTNDTEPFDLVLLDFMMPGLSGLQVLEGLRARWSQLELPVIMATARDGSEDIVRALNTGANDYVVKPFDPEVLQARVRGQLRTKRLADLRSQFTQLVSHDLRGLLTVLKGGTSALKFAVPPGRAMTPVAFQLLSNLHENALELQRMLEDFLQAKGLHETFGLRSFPFSINQVVTQVSSLFKPYAEQKDVHLTTALEASDPTVQGDPKLIRHIMQNFIDNAIKFAPPEIIVTCTTQLNGETVVVSVSDNGPGIPEEDLPNLFIKGKPLTNRPTGGEQSTHIGLPMCKYYLQLHGTDLEVKNNADAGVCFSFSLPMA